MRLGFHIPIAGGWPNTVRKALRLHCSTLQVFTSAPVQWAARPLEPEAAAWFREELRRLDIQPLFVHAIYLLNLASADEMLWRKSRDHLAEELRRAAMIGAEGVIFHLGSAGEGGDVRQGRKRLVRALDGILAGDDGPVHLILENCASTRESVGCSFEDLAWMIDKAKQPERLRVCLDTAHAFAHGYPLHTLEGLAETLDLADATFGLDRIAVIHTNDSRGAFGSGVDRHWHIGKGQIGAAAFRTILAEPRLRHLPFIMETPAEGGWDARNMRAIRRLVDPAYRPVIRRVPKEYRD